MFTWAKAAEVALVAYAVYVVAQGFSEAKSQVNATLWRRVFLLEAFRRAML